MKGNNKLRSTKEANKQLKRWKWVRSWAHFTDEMVSKRKLWLIKQQLMFSFLKKKKNLDEYTVTATIIIHSIPLRQNSTTHLIVFYHPFQFQNLKKEPWKQIPLLPRTRSLFQTLSLCIVIHIDFSHTLIWNYWMNFMIVCFLFLSSHYTDYLLIYRLNEGWNEFLSQEKKRTWIIEQKSLRSHKMHLWIIYWAVYAT